MDSGNTRSSSGHEEFDSRSDQSAAPPAFFHSSYLSNINNNFGYQQMPSTSFDIPAAAAAASSNSYLQHALLSQSHDQHKSDIQSPFFNLDLVGSRSCTSDSTTTVAHHHHHQYGLPFSSSSMQQQQLQAKNVEAVGKNPKKRTRTSRRAPTTVLTTDTSNFRSMVQEFTGIPAQPFSIGSSYSRRLGPYSSGSAAVNPSSPSSSSGNNNPVGAGAPLQNNYPLRPTIQNFQPNHFSAIASSPSSSSSASMINRIASRTGLNNTSSRRSNYQLLSDLGGISNSNTLMQQNLHQRPDDVSFQSLLHRPISPLNRSFAAANTSSHFGLPSFEDHHDEFAAMSHHSNIIEQLSDHHDDHLIRSSHHGNRIGHSSSLPQRVTGSCNLMNRSSDFHDDDHHKNLKTVSSRGGGEGTSVDSWICPSE